MNEQVSKTIQNKSHMSLHSKDVEPGDLLTSMDASLVVECLLFSVQIV